MKMNKIVIDLDLTLTLPGPEPYAEKRPNLAVIEVLRRYKQAGFEIAIYTARNMRTHNGNIGKISALTIPSAIDWLRKHDIPFDEFWPAKPWCGPDGFYVDDRAIRPSEFVALSHDQIKSLIFAENSK